MLRKTQNEDKEIKQKLFLNPLRKIFKIRCNIKRF